jgi:hypothetical protein
MKTDFDLSLPLDLQEPLRHAPISLQAPHEVRNWTESMNCTELQLRIAVATVGYSAEKVRQYLQR